jgi:hypothetical protein
LDILVAGVGRVQPKQLGTISEQKFRPHLRTAGPLFLASEDSSFVTSAE